MSPVDVSKPELHFVAKTSSWTNLPARSSPLVGPLSICGADQRRAASCFADDDPDAYTHASPVGRLLVGSLSCTAWRVGGGNHWLTNNHCLRNPRSVNSAEVWLGYERRGCNGAVATPVKAKVRSILYTDDPLDFTLFSVEGLSEVDRFGFLGLDVREPSAGEAIYIPQHGGGDPKQLATRSDQGASGFCEVDAPTLDGRAADTDMGYTCDTEGGSSGSPVLARDSHRVLGLHHYGGCLNQGVRMSLIWPQIAPFFADEVPTEPLDGDLGNTPPHPDFDAVVDGASVTFVDHSTDADGTLAKRAWYFGDGTTSSQTDPHHVFEVSGTHHIRLTVVDNTGAPASVAHNIEVRRVSGAFTELGSGRPVRGLAGARNQWTYYRLRIPPEARHLLVDLRGGVGNADLYVGVGTPPTEADHTCRSAGRTNTERCFVPVLAGTEVFMGVFGTLPYSDVELSARVAHDGDPNGVTLLEGRGLYDAWLYATVDVPFGSDRLDVVTSGGQGDADLFVQYDIEPTATRYDCASERNGNNEVCRIFKPRPGRWYIGLLGYNNFSGVTVDARYHRL